MAFEDAKIYIVVSSCFSYGESLEDVKNFLRKQGFQEKNIINVDDYSQIPTKSFFYDGNFIIGTLF